MELKYSSRQVLYDIQSMKTFAKQLLGKGKKYDHFLRQLLKPYFLSSDEYTPTTIKLVAERAGLKYDTVRKYLHLIYEDLIKHDENHLDFAVNRVEYTFTMHYFDEYAYLTVNHLPILPRVGEQVNIPYFKAKVGTSMFYVESVDHLFTDKVQYVGINLRAGYFNHYWQIRKDEAFIKGEISPHEYYQVRDSQLKERLKLQKY